jgi:PhnB protein
MKISSHLTFNGQCEAAFRRYQAILGGELYVLSYGQTPMSADVPPAMRDKVVHATLSLGACSLAGADVRPEEYSAPQGFYVLVSPAGPAEARRIFDSLAEGGEVRMPLQKAFWTPAFGVLVDRFGIPWEVSAEQTS